MSTTKAQQKAVNKYVKRNYDRLNVVLPKGRKAAIQSAADAAQQSLNGYVVQAIENRMEHEEESQGKTSET